MATLRAFLRDRATSPRSEVGPSGSPPTRSASQPRQVPNHRTTSDPIEAIVRPPVANQPSFSDSVQDRSIFVSPELSLPTASASASASATRQPSSPPPPVPAASASAALSAPSSSTVHTSAGDTVYPLAEVPHLPNGPRRTRFESLEPGAHPATRRAVFSPRGPWPLSRPELQSASLPAHNNVAAAASSDLPAADDPTEPLLSSATRVQAAVEERVRQARSDLDAVRARLTVLDGEHRELERERRGMQHAFEERATGPRSIWTVPADEDEEAAELGRARQRVARRMRADVALNPGDTESSLRNARQALRTAVLYAERLELVTRTLSSMADLPATTRATSVQRAGAGAGAPLGERHARVFPPGASASIQRSLAQLRAAQARIEQALEEQAAERQAERLERAAGSSGSSDATARGAELLETNGSSDRQPTLGQTLDRGLVADTSSAFDLTQARRQRLSLLFPAANTASPANPPAGQSSRSARTTAGDSSTSPYAPFVPPSLRGLSSEELPHDPSEAPPSPPARRTTFGGGFLDPPLRPVGGGAAEGVLDTEGGSPGEARRRRKYTLAVKLDANGDAVEEETGAEKEERRKGRRELVGR